MPYLLLVITFLRQQDLSQGLHSHFSNRVVFTRHIDLIPCWPWIREFCFWLHSISYFLSSPKWKLSPSLNLFMLHLLYSWAFMRKIRRFAYVTLIIIILWHFMLSLSFSYILYYHLKENDYYWPAESADTVWCWKIWAHVPWALTQQFRLVGLSGWSPFSVALASSPAVQ